MAESSLSDPPPRVPVSQASRDLVTTDKGLAPRIDPPTNLRVDTPRDDPKTPRADPKTPRADSTPPTTSTRPDYSRIGRGLGTLAALGIGAAIGGSLRGRRKGRRSRRK
jgi:hypothetical protein